MDKKSNRKGITLGIAVLMMVYSIDAAYALGSGGILNLIPQAQVQVEHNGSKRLVADYKVYVHPMEGSIVLLSPGTQIVLALDKYKKKAVEFDVGYVKMSKDGTTIDVSEKTPYKVLRTIPHFGRTQASMRRDDGSRLIVSVKR